MSMNFLGRLYFKVVLVVATVVTAVMAAIIAVNVRVQRDHQYANLVKSAVRLTEATYVAYKKPMAAGDSPSVDEALRNATEGMTGFRIHVFDKSLKVVFASPESDVGHHLGDFVPDAMVMKALRQSFESDGSALDVFNDTGNSDYPLGVFKPIPSEASCTHCHGVSERVLGGMLVSTSLEEQAKQNAALRNVNLAVSLAGGLVILLLLLWLLSTMIIRPVREMSRAAEAIAAGDLTYRLQDSESAPRRKRSFLARIVQRWSEDEITGLARSFTAMTEGLRSMLTALNESAVELQRQSKSLLSTASRQAAMASQQAAAVSRTSATVAEISQSSVQAQRYSDEVLEVATRSESLGRTGQEVVAQATASMAALVGQVQAIGQSISEAQQRTQQIGQIMASVRELAEESNLLALNAAIEAARAGEEGRGFAVVANEVRDLAAQSAAATAKVRTILLEIQKSMDAAVSASNEGTGRANAVGAMAEAAGSSITGLAAAVQESSAAARQIAGNTREQAQGIGEIVHAVADVSTATDEMLASSRQTEVVAANLGEVAAKLSGLIQRYRT